MTKKKKVSSRPSRRKKAATNPGIPMPWVVNDRNMSGCGAHKKKKGMIPRKEKYKKNDFE